MAGRVGFGPVFAFECRLGARRWQVYAARVALLVVLLAGLAVIWETFGRGVDLRTQGARVGSFIFATVVTIQVAAALLVAPVAAAGALCIDKTRGTLLHALVTDLSDWEIVAGKLAARLTPALSLLLCGVPVLALCSLLGGFDAKAVAGAYLATAGVAVVGAALALALSVWARKVHQALIPAYVVLGLWAGLLPALEALTGPSGTKAYGVDRLLWLTNPFGNALAPYVAGTPAGLPEQSAFLAVCLIVAAALAVVTARRLRPVVVGEASRPARRGRPGLAAKLVALLPEPPLDVNPVTWREWHRKRPSRWAGRFWTAYAAASGLASALALACFYYEPGDQTAYLAGQVNGWGVAIGLLLLAVSAATALADERDRGSLDVVLATSLSTWQVVWGKWWGAFAMVPRLAIFPVWVASGLAMITGRISGVAWLVGLILMQAAAITSLGLAAATWVRRPGRAVAVSVLAYGILSLGWYLAVTAITALIPGGRLLPEARSILLIGDPYFSALAATYHAGSLWSSTYFGHYPWYWYNLLAYAPGWTLFWVVAYQSAAFALLLATAVTFDRCLGRIPDRARAFSGGARQRQGTLPLPAGKTDQ